MKNIYLIRHGVTDWNIEGRIQGRMESNLTQEGREQAKKAADFLKNKDIDHIYSSDLRRAYETATIINKSLNKEIEKTKLLREADFGVWEGKTLDEVLEIDEENYLKWLKEPEYCKIEAGESLDDLRKRCQSFLDSIDKSHDTILIVAHSTILKMLILTILDIDKEHFKNLSLNNTGISKLEVKDYNTVIRYYNSISHLEEK